MANDVIVTGDYNRARISRMQKRKEIVRVSPGIYVRDGVSPTAAIRREWLKVLGHIHPGAVITDRSAPRVQPDDEGRIFVAIDHRSRAEQKLPGLTIVTREGLPPQPDDTELPHGVFLASDGRALVENLIPRRTPADGVRRTLTEEELGDWLSRISDPRRIERAALSGGAAKVAAQHRGLERRGRELLDAALGKRELTTSSNQLSARSRGLPFDQARITSFQTVARHLKTIKPRDLRSSGTANVKAFYESYFSNFIEGTEFTLEEARRIIYGGIDPAGRPADAHDVRSVFNLVNDESWSVSVPASPLEFVQLLRDRHSVMMEEHPETLPGQFKSSPNRVGTRYFVAPEEVEGTLIEAFPLIDGLEDPFARGVLAHYVVAEVHPFMDGNGRSARLMMNAELEKASLARIIIPTAYRDNYLSGLRALAAHGNPDPMTRSLSDAQEWTANIPWDTLESAEAAIELTNGFLLPDEAAELHRHLIIRAEVEELDVEEFQFTRNRAGPKATPTRRVLNQCPKITNDGTRCKNRRWSGEVCHAHHWRSPWV